MKNSMIKLLRLFVGFFICAIGIVCTINASLGLTPWDVLHQGLSKTINITVGQASMTVGFIFIILDIILGENLGWGTVLNMIFIGVFIDLLMINEIIPIANTLFSGVVMMFLGMMTLGIGCVFYIGAGFGSGPRDGMMIAMHKKFNRPIKIIRSIMEICALIVGYFLGGSIGVGTLIAAIGLGYCMQFAFKILNFNASEVKHRYIIQDIQFIKGVVISPAYLNRDDNEVYEEK